MQQADVGERDRSPEAAGDRSQASCEATKPRGAGAAPASTTCSSVEAADARRAVGLRSIADGLHRPCSVRSTLSALIARGMPV